MARGKSAATLAQLAGISEFELSMIEQGVYENLTQEIVANIAFNLGLAPKPDIPAKKEEKQKEDTQVTKSKKKYGRGRTLTDAERATRIKEGREIREFRLKHGLSAAAVERASNLPVSMLNKVEDRGVSLIPGRKKEIMDAMQQLVLEHQDTKTKPTPKGPTIVTAEQFYPTQKPKPKGFVVSTEHKLTCGDYELLASVSGDDFTLSIANKNELMILEGQKKDKGGMLAALKHIIHIIES